MNSSISPEIIGAQLLKILKAPAFQNSVTLSRFLQFIVEQTLSGHETELKEYTIAVKVLSKRPDFNPQSDPIVRIHAGRLRRSLNEYYLEEGKEDELVISIPKGAYVPLFSSRSKPVEDAPVANSRKPVSRKRITVAVLPFSNIQSDANTVAFADGLGDHISTELTRYTELSVISYYSCRNIINRITDIKEAGLALDAMYILTGSIQSDKNRLRIRVQLILTETREQVWASSYERQNTSAELFEVQDEIVWHVVSQTAGHYGAIARNVAKLLPQKNAGDPGIYNAIFWYYHFVGDLSEQTFFNAESAMNKAVETDPGYALGWAVLGEIFIGGYFMGYKSRLTENQLEQAVAYGKTAIRIDPNCQHAYQTMAIAHVFLKNSSECIKVIDEWQKIKPAEAGIKGAMGFVLICCGVYEQGFKMLDESVQLNPYYQWFFNAGFAFYYFHHDDFSNALYWAEKMNMPGVHWEKLLKIASCSKLGLMDEAKRYCSQLQRDFPNIKTVLKDYLGTVLRDEQLAGKMYQSITGLL